MLDDYLDTQLITLTEYLIDNPGLHQNKIYKVHEVIDFPDEFNLESGELFAIMSSAFSLNKKKREAFFQQHPRTKDYLSKLGPNRRQYAIILFGLLRRIDDLVIGIIRKKISLIADQEIIIELYELHKSFRYRKAIFLASPDKTRARIILFESDSRIRNLRYLDDHKSLEE